MLDWDQNIFGGRGARTTGTEDGVVARTSSSDLFDLTWLFSPTSSPSTNSQQQPSANHKANNSAYTNRPTLSSGSGTTIGKEPFRAHRTSLDSPKKEFPSCTSVQGPFAHNKDPSDFPYGFCAYTPPGCFQVRFCRASTHSTAALHVAAQVCAHHGNQRSHNDAVSLSR